MLAVAVLLLAAYLLFPRPKQVLTAVVQRGTIISTVQTTGKLEAQKSAKLSFRTSGQVTKVIKKQGDTVEVGDTLAELDTVPLRRQLDQARVQLNISKLRLQQAQEGAMPADVAAATAQLNGATAALDQTKAGARPEDIAAAQAQLNQAQAKLDATKRGPKQADIAAAQARLDQATANRDLVATTAANTREQARIAYNDAKGAATNFLDPGGQVEQARLNYEAAQKSETAQVSAANAQVSEAQQALNALKAGPSAEEVLLGQEGVAQAKANLDKLKNGPTASELAQAQARVDAARAALDKVNAGPAATDVAILQQQINLAQLSVDAASDDLAKAQIIAPMNGTVLNIDLEVGETINAMQPVATIADSHSLRIKADVDEIDIGRVSTGQAVTVTLDAYPGVKLAGRIEALAPGATLKQGSTVYQATVSFTSSDGVLPREGMAANVDITAQRKENVLLLPNRAFETVGTRQYVTVAGGEGSARKVEVETGLSNATDTEVISGLDEGQVVTLK